MEGIEIVFIVFGVVALATFVAFRSYSKRKKN